MNDWIMNNRRNLIFILVIIVFATLLTLNADYNGVKFGISDNQVAIKGPEKYSFSIPFEKIATIEIIRELDKGTCLSGNESRGYAYGTWKNEAYGEYQLCIANGIKSYVIITDTLGNHYVYNVENEKTTEDSGTTLITYLQGLGFPISD